MSEIYTREFTGYYDKGSNEEERVLLHEAGYRLSKELSDAEALLSRKTLTLYHLAEELKVVESAALREPLIARQQWLIVSRNALAKHLQSLKKQQQAQISQVSRTNNTISPSHDYIHNVHYTKVNPDLMITESEMYDDHTEQLTREAAAPAPAPADNQEIVLAA